jgi:protein required for attachment to host cells
MVNSKQPQSEKTFWIVVADESRAIVYTKELKRDPLQELFTLDNEVAREKMADLISDRGGRSFDSHGQGRHTMAREKSDPKTQASIAFAKDIADRITRAKNDGSCRDFALIAAPRFLGSLRDALSTAGNAEPVVTIDKQVVDQDTDFIERLVAEHHKF